MVKKIIFLNSTQTLTFSSTRKSVTQRRTHSKRPCLMGAFFHRLASLHRGPPHSYPFPCSPLPHPTISTQEREQSTFFMSSTGQVTSSLSTVQSIIDALVDYTTVTGIDLSKNPFAATIEHSNSPEVILELLQEREKAFKEYRDGNWRLISCLRPAVKVIHLFSGILGEAVSLVSHTSHPCSSLNNFIRSRFHREKLCLLPSILSLLYIP